MVRSPGQGSIHGHESPDRAGRTDAARAYGAAAPGARRSPRGTQARTPVTAPASPTPVELRYDRAAHVLHVTFDNDERFAYTAEFLRVHSPSAEVRGHGPGQEVLQVGKERVGIETIEPVGNYAVRLCFDDGHDTGPVLLGGAALARHPPRTSVERLPGTPAGGRPSTPARCLKARSRGGGAMRDTTATSPAAVMAERRRPAWNAVPGPGVRP